MNFEPIKTTNAQIHSSNQFSRLFFRRIYWLFFQLINISNSINMPLLARLVEYSVSQWKWENRFGRWASWTRIKITIHDTFEICSVHMFCQLFYDAHTGIYIKHRLNCCALCQWTLKTRLCVHLRKSTVRSRSMLVFTELCLEQAVDVSAHYVEMIVLRTDDGWLNSLWK